MKNTPKKQHFLIAHNPMVAIILSFLIIILLGTILLCFPFFNRSGEWLSPLSALFTATSATCVTGLTVGDTFTMFTFWGQLIILIMIQIGGLGFMSIAMMMMVYFRRSSSFAERRLFSSSFGLDSSNGATSFVKMVVWGSFMIEGIGAVLLSFHFIPKNGFLSGCWKSLFISISSFCNAGFDILGHNDSIASLRENAFPMLIIILLTVLGGLGFPIWHELLKKKKGEHYSVYFKLVLSTTAILLFGGTLFYLLAEWKNPLTLGSLSPAHKLLNAFFCSVTMRTVGFSTFDMAGFYDPTKLFSCFLMFIGGSSASTAGGIKTVTAAIIIITAFQVACGRNKIQFHCRTIDQKDIYRAFSLFFIGLSIILVCGTTICFLVPSAGISNVFFTCVSAFGTVGCAAVQISALPAIAQIILIVMMFLGRVGILSVTLAIMVRLNRNKDLISYPKTNILIG